MKKKIVGLAIMVTGHASAQINIAVPQIPDMWEGKLAAATLPAAQCPAGYVSGAFILLPTTSAASASSMRTSDFFAAASAKPLPGFCKAGQAFTFTGPGYDGRPMAPFPYPVCGDVYFIEQGQGDLHCGLRGATAAENTLLADKLSTAQVQLDNASKQATAAEQRDAAMQKTIEALRACIKDKAACKNL